MSFYRKLALYSDQEIPANEEMDDRLLRLIGRPQPRIGYIPATSDLERAYFQRKADYYAGIGANLAVYVDPSQETSEAEWKTLLSCDAIHLSGGNTFSFLSWLQRQNVLPILTRYVSEGGVLVGVSAGAILMTPSVDSALLCGDVRDEPLIDHAGLGLVDFHFWPHFNSDSVTQDQLRLSSTIPDLYACPDGAGIVIDGNEVELFGQVHRYDFGEIRPTSHED
ncbi:MULTISPECIES: Type 1 glutamine amidotransferase-like domain-containing protein [Burkholderia]|uniref:Type 1 glutamine amidotransferase-like domain-containing protein n=1 Tax=Burkholderia TaxID=32008 RepID=UPI000F5B69E3|nr:MULTISPECIES: Type 1 glutamine amidotransferase-like domain-containing protein [Burkholderia]MBN3737479.1 type 1 glutamine amidotransferase-like domain-containing protein [Burkholderia sp. Tr-20355]MDN7853450.1 Type 1 glutamine amidotransferase-like domain-containing protein [Burkholderia seminalis]RQS68574.1 dipeptidase E [Burkholderia seminalis]